MGKIRRNDPCPCESGKKFKQCCYGKRFEWVVKDGQLFQNIPMPDEVVEAMVKLKEEFVRHFEREPEGDDPVFLMKYLYSDRDVERILIEAMKKAEIDPALIYAYGKTGYLMTQFNREYATGDAIGEWNEALDKFYGHGGDPEEQTEGYQFDVLVKNTQSEIESLIFLFGFIIEKYLNTEIIFGAENEENILTPLQYIALCVARSHKTLRSIGELLEKHMGDDALSLTRSVYENYLHAIYVTRYPERIAHLVDAVVGLHEGTHEYEKIQGKINKRTIVDKATGKKYMGHVAAYKMAESSTLKSDLQFFDHFYDKASEIVHPNVLSLDSYIGEEGLDPLFSKLYEEAVLYSVLVGAMLAQHVMKLPICTQSVQRDIATVVKRIQAKLHTILDFIEVWQSRSGQRYRGLGAIRGRVAELID